MKKCILIFDDDEQILYVCKIILEQQNYRVETRLSCENIIEDIDCIKPDMILLDLRIPEIGGENALSLVRNHKANLNIPVVLFSADTKVEEISNRTHANGFIKKPFEIESLLDIVGHNVRRLN
jgi:DNA-binding NtrC family response regulator